MQHSRIPRCLTFGSFWARHAYSGQFVVLGIAVAACFFGVGCSVLETQLALLQPGDSGGHTERTIHANGGTVGVHRESIGGP